MNETLGKEYEEWLDKVEKTLPLPIPEEDNMTPIRNRLVHQIHEKIAKLEVEMFSYDFHSTPWVECSREIDHLREKLRDIMNSQCPLLKGKNG